MTDVFHSYEPYAGREGSVYRVLVTDVSHDGRYLVGHNDCYEQVLVPKDDDLMGKLVTVKVVETSKFSMVGELASDPAARPTPFKPLVKGQVSGGVKAKQDVAAVKPESSNNHTVMYSVSIALLGLAILVRLFQLLQWTKPDLRT